MIYSKVILIVVGSLAESSLDRSQISIQPLTLELFPEVQSAWRSISSGELITIGMYCISLSSCVLFLRFSLPETRGRARSCTTGGRKRETVQHVTINPSRWLRHCSRALSTPNNKAVY